MNLITKQLLAQAAPLRLAFQYRDRMDVALWNDHTPQEDYDALVASDLRPETVDKIMGNASWTQIQCSACRKDVERACVLDVTGGEYTTHLCEPCAKKICELFR